MLCDIEDLLLKYNVKIFIYVFSECSQYIIKCMVNGCYRLERELLKTRIHNVNSVSITFLRKDVITHDNVLIVL